MAYTSGCSRFDGAAEDAEDNMEERDFFDEMSEQKKHTLVSPIATSPESMS